MPVSVMLQTLSSKELTEWRAYEVLNGPLDDAWRDEAQANILDLIRMLSYITSQGHFGQDSKGKPVQGPIEVPKKPYTRPQYTFLPEPTEEELMSEEDVERLNAEQIARMDAVLSKRENQDGRAG